MNTLPQRTGPLVGLKVLEIGHYIAAPFCARILADLGAEVIKVEPPGGDPFRGWGAAVNGNSVWFSVHGRNKLSVELDLKRERAIAMRLAARADVVVENLRARRAGADGPGPDEIHAANPRLVIAPRLRHGQDGRTATSLHSARSARQWAGCGPPDRHPAGTSDPPPPRCGVARSATTRKPACGDRAAGRRCGSGMSTGHPGRGPAW